MKPDPSDSTPSFPPPTPSAAGRDSSPQERPAEGLSPDAAAPQDGAEVRQRLEELQGELRDLFYRCFQERQRLTGLESKPQETTLQLSLKLPPPTAGSPQTGQLYRQVKEAATRFADRSAAFPSGHVYCYWCRSFTCPHATPPESRSVFRGYSPTGQPLWREFASVLLERGDPRTEHLFRDGSPATIPLVQSGGELASKQLAVYGKRSPIYHILGQIVLGYLVPPRSENGDRAPFAVTFQAVEAAGGNSPAHLNILGVLADGTPASEALEEFFDPRLMDAIRSARRRLSEIAVSRGPRRSRRRRSRETARRSLEALRLLAKNFDRIFRQRSRRTLHSQDRHRNRQRPASVALRDALNAGRDTIYRDVEENTWVVIGPKNRVHVFNDLAMHVTSIAYPGETVRQRTTRGKWVAPPPERTAGFLQALRARFRKDE